MLHDTLLLIGLVGLWEIAQLRVPFMGFVLMSQDRVGSWNGTSAGDFRNWCQWSAFCVCLLFPPLFPLRALELLFLHPFAPAHFEHHRNFFDRASNTLGSKKRPGSHQDGAHVTHSAPGG